VDDRRYEQFEQDAARLKVSNGAPTEVWLARLGVVAAIAGPVIGVVAYFGSLSTNDPRGQTDMVIFGLIGISVTVVGVGLFLRYSVVRFFRFWAARIVYELNDKARAPNLPARDDGMSSVRSDRENIVSH
jgi:hypothetical protein